VRGCLTTLAYIAVIVIGLLVAGVVLGALAA